MEKRSLFVEEIYTECELDVPAAKVYSVLADFPNYPRWTPDMTLSGDTRPGGRMKLVVRERDRGWITLSSVMIGVDEGAIAFNNTLIAPFIFFGRHRFEPTPLSENRTRLVNAEVFSGLAIPFIRRSFVRNEREFKENTNAALKKAVEAL